MHARSSWLWPASSFFVMGVAALSAGFLVGPGCQSRCSSNFDCGTSAYCVVATGRCETECFADEDCRRPPECQDNPTACRPKGLSCNGYGRCVGIYNPVAVGSTRESDIDTLPPVIDGWEDPPGSGRAFIINQIGVATQDGGFDIDGKCTDDGCIDNFLWRLGELGNDQIRQGLLGGESLLLIELAGLNEPYRGDDESMTIKIYGARDADVPFFPANNFTVPPSHTTCCEFKINPQSLSGLPPQARARSPARIERGRLRSLAPVPIQFTLTVGTAPHPEVRLERVLFSGRVPSALDEFDDGLLGGAIPVNTLAQTDNPYCKTVSPRCPVQFTDSTLIDLVSTLLGPIPDVDLDLDGLECAKDTDGDGSIDLCCDGHASLRCNPASSGCPGDIIPPVDPMKPASCALHPKMADGYSIGITFTAVRASIVGVGQ